MRRDGALREVMRRTSVHASTFFPIMLPITFSGYGLEAKAGFARSDIEPYDESGEIHAIRSSIRTRMGIADDRHVR